jgi:hypothetical protein
MTTNYLFSLAAVAVAVVACSRDPDQDCSVTCIGDGLAISAEVCSDEVLRYQRCKTPELVREPVSGELVSVLSDGESRKTIVVSVSDDGEFLVGGPPASAELGSAVVALSDDALLGVVQSYSDSISTCSAP